MISSHHNHITEIAEIYIDIFNEFRNNILELGLKPDTQTGVVSQRCSDSEIGSKS
jgi:hypothetical protein